MKGYKIIAIEADYVKMVKSDGHGGTAKTGMTVQQFKEKFGKEPKVGIVA